jgi:hypothetical protein
MDVLQKFREFRAAVRLATEEESSVLVAQAAQLKASVAPTIAKYQALATMAQADADLHEAAGESFKVQLVSKVRSMEVDAGVAETGVTVQKRFVVSQERLSAVMQTQQELTSKYSHILAGGDRLPIGQSAQKQLPW